MKYQHQTKAVILSGIDLRNSLDIYQNDIGMKITEGRWPSLGKREIVVGSLVPTDVFPGLKINTTATIKGRRFEVVGVLKSMGSKQDDTMVGIDINLYQGITGERKEAPQAIAKISQGYSVDQVAKNIKTNLE